MTVWWRGDSAWFCRDVHAEFRGAFPLVARHGEERLGRAVLVPTAAGATDLLTRAVEYAADPLGDGGQRAERVADQAPGGPERGFAGLQCRLLEGVGLLHRLELRNGADLADQAAQPGVTRRGEGPVVGGGDRIAVLIGEWS